VTPRLKAIFFLIMVNLLWGLSFPTAKALNLQLDQQFSKTVSIDSDYFRVAAATWIIASRFGLAFVLFVIFFRRIVRRATMREWLAGSVIGAFFLTGLIMQTMGLATIPASRSGFLTSLSVVFTPAFAALLHARRPTWLVLAGILLSIFGVALLTGLVVYDANGIHLAPDATIAWTKGDTFTTVATIFFACQILCIDRFAKSLNAEAFTPGMFLTVTVAAVLLFSVVRGRTDAALPLSGFIQLSCHVQYWSLIILLAFLPSLLSFSWMNTYQPHVTAVQAAVIYTTEPVFVTLWALFLPGLLSQLFQLPLINEHLSVPILVGGAVILLANVLALWPTELITPPEKSREG
jgi:drug/metabolite transporter (DMT)-like permease